MLPARQPLSSGSVHCFQQPPSTRFSLGWRTSAHPPICRMRPVVRTTSSPSRRGPQPTRLIVPVWRRGTLLRDQATAATEGQYHPHRRHVRRRDRRQRRRAHAASRRNPVGGGTVWRTSTATPTSSTGRSATPRWSSARSSAMATWRRSRSGTEEFKAGRVRRRGSWRLHRQPHA